MNDARLRITHATTGAEYVYGADLLSDAPLVLREAVAPDGAFETGGVSVVLTADSVLGVPSKPLPEGRHRAVVEILDGAAWTAVADGTASNERSSCSSTYRTPQDGLHGGALVREWTVEVADTALEDALDLMDVDLVPSGNPVNGQVVVATGGGLEQHPAACYEARAVLVTAGAAAGVAVTGPGGGPLPPVAGPDDVCLTAPHPNRRAAGLPWTGTDVLNWWRAMRPLVVRGRYEAYPGRALTVEVSEGDGPAAYAVAPDGAADLDNVDGDRAWEQADWSTEPAAEDGTVYDDLAVTWTGGADGSRIDAPGVLDVPLRATYAAARASLPGLPERARDGGREHANRQTLELPTRLVAHDALSLAQTTADGVTTRYARPVIDFGVDEGAVYALVLITVFGALRSVVDRQVEGSDRPTMELWADALYPGVSARYADRDVLRFDVPNSALAGAVVGRASVVAEGLVWQLAEREADRDGGDASVSLVRPSPRVAGGGDGGPDRYEPDPDASGAYREGDADSGQPAELTITVSVLHQAEVPASVDVESVSGEPSDSVRSAVTPSASNVREWTLYATSASGSYLGSEWRARVTYPSGTVSEWVDVRLLPAPTAQ